MSIQRYLQKNCQNLNNKNVVVTGATGGLGKEICYGLARLNANITLACRKQELAEKLKQELLKINPNLNVNFVKLDLQDFACVNTCIQELKKLNGIDILINNAGIFNVPLKTLEFGYNNVFQVNFASTYYFTKKLLPELEIRPNSMCITMSSIAHNYCKLNQEDLDYTKCGKQSKIYGISKRMLMFSLFKLFKETRVNLAIVHPGVTLTNITNHYPKAINWLVKIGIKLVFPSPANASRSALLATSKKVDYMHWLGPPIFNVWGRPKMLKLKTSTPDEIGKIYQIAEDIYEKMNKPTDC